MRIRTIAHIAVPQPRYLSASAGRPVIPRSVSTVFCLLTPCCVNRSMVSPAAQTFAPHLTSRADIACGWCVRTAPREHTSNNSKQQTSSNCTAGSYPEDRLRWKTCFWDPAGSPFWGPENGPETAGPRVNTNCRGSLFVRRVSANKMGHRSGPQALQ